MVTLITLFGAFALLGYSLYSAPDNSTGSDSGLSAEERAAYEKAQREYEEALRKAAEEAANGSGSSGTQDTTPAPSTPSTPSKPANPYGEMYFGDQSAPYDAFYDYSKSDWNTPEEMRIYSLAGRGTDILRARIVPETFVLNKIPAENYYSRTINTGIWYEAAFALEILNPTFVAYKDLYIVFDKILYQNTELFMYDDVTDNGRLFYGSSVLPYYLTFDVPAKSNQLYDVIIDGSIRGKKYRLSAKFINEGTTTTTATSPAQTTG